MISRYSLPVRAMAWTVLTCAGMAAVVRADEPMLTGKAELHLEPFDKLLVKFVHEDKMPGAALAVARQGKLVYARGCGLADVDQKESVQPTSLFRVASLSKPITAVAVLQLIEQGRVNLDNSILDYLPDSVVIPPEKRESHPWRKITVRHCLHHTGGWDNQKSHDPMFRTGRIADDLKIPSPASAVDVVRYMTEQPVDFPAGEKYVYSNFGYNILGRIIEKVSGKTYEQYVRDHVFQPVGAKTARLGKTLLKDRAPGEVRYYQPDEDGRSVFQENRGEKVPGPYGAWNLEAMDAHGGWVCSAVDLVRFGASFDTNPRISLLKPETRKLVVEPRPSGPVGLDAKGQPLSMYYGLGWQVRRGGDADHVNLWHHGSLPGTSTLLIHRMDDFTFAILFNTRTQIGKQWPSRVADDRIYTAVGEVNEWPSTDLFETIDASPQP